MRVGSMRSALGYQSRSEVATTGGGQTVTWTPVATIRAQVLPEPGFEQMVGGGVQSLKRWKVTARYRADVNEKGRFVRATDGLTLEILNIEDVDGRKQVMICHCAEKI